ncbi:MAG TPA: ribonuclease H-like domain-containing protein [Bryobacteraceae bacterium]|nr:ribonuclease H-like domain-containing protein [Bryobacteraceae bacterium]
MLNTEEQLARLKQRIAAIDLRFTQRSFAAPQFQAEPITEEEIAPSEPVRSRIEEWADGEVVQNQFGEHYQTERLFPANRQHGATDIGSLAELPPDLMDALGDGEVPSTDCERWAFLDTETTGLAGGSGTYAFLIGVGRITTKGFHLRQFFMREYAEEISVLAALTDYLAGFDVLITYNGKTYDQPLLETRYRMCRYKPPFSRLAHLDLLHGARRLWKLRLESCRLMQLEQQILGFYREGDLPGEMIPYVYFEYLRSREAHRLMPVFHHNAIDILTLACLTAIVPAAFRDTGHEALGRLGVRRGEDLSGIARWLIAANEPEKGLELLKRAVDSGLPDRFLFKALWDIALLEKKLQRPHAALKVFTELAGCSNEYRSCAFVELAKYYEHEERNYGLALEFTNEALSFNLSPELTHRKARLERRLSKSKPRRLL